MSPKSTPGSRPASNAKNAKNCVVNCNKFSILQFTACWRILGLCVFAVLFACSNSLTVWYCKRRCHWWSRYPFITTLEPHCVIEDLINWFETSIGLFLPIIVLRICFREDGEQTPVLLDFFLAILSGYLRVGLRLMLEPIMIGLNMIAPTGSS